MKTCRIRIMSAIAIVSALTSSLLASVSFAAGGGHTGGGKAIVCQDRVFAVVPFPTNRVWLADTFNEVALNGGWIYDQPLSGDLLDAIIYNVMDSIKPGLGTRVEKRVEQLEFRHLTRAQINKIYGQSAIPDVPDDFINLKGKANLFCRKIQVAIQYRDKNYVDVDASIFHRLKPIDQRLLLIHEGLISLYPEARDTTPIRKLVTQTLNSPEMGLSLIASLNLVKLSRSLSLRDRAYVNMLALTVGLSTGADAIRVLERFDEAETRRQATSQSSFVYAINPFLLFKKENRGREADLFIGPKSEKHTKSYLKNDSGDRLGSSNSMLWYTNGLPPRYLEVLVRSQLCPKVTKEDLTPIVREFQRAYSVVESSPIDIAIKMGRKFCE